MWKFQHWPFEPCCIWSMQNLGTGSLRCFGAMPALREGERERGREGERERGREGERERGREGEREGEREREREGGTCKTTFNIIQLHVRIWFLKLKTYWLRNSIIGPFYFQLSQFFSSSEFCVVQNPPRIWSWTMRRWTTWWGVLVVCLCLQNWCFFSP